MYVALWLMSRKEKEYKNIKCAIGSILVDRVHGDSIRKSIEQRCLAVSRMAARASIICQLMLETLLKQEKEISEEEKKEWPDFTKQNVFSLSCLPWASI